MVFSPVAEMVRERAVEKRSRGQGAGGRGRIMQGFGGLKQRVGDFILGAQGSGSF